MRTMMISPFEGINKANIPFSVMILNSLIVLLIANVGIFFELVEKMLCHVAKK